MVGLNKAVEVKFSLFDIEYHPNCDSDYLAIYDGPDRNSNLIGKYCGSSPPAFLISSSNYMTLEYITDYYETKEGFILDWRFVIIKEYKFSVFQFFFRETLGPLEGCGGVLTDDSGVIESPDPQGLNQYDNYLNCVWMIQADTNKIIQLQFDRFDMEPHASGGGCYDYVEVIHRILLKNKILLFYILLNLF